MSIAYIGLGSNVGDRLENLRRAIAALEAPGVSVRKVSSVYETAPVGPIQPDFLNAVAEVSTGLDAPNLLAVLEKIEAQIGRTPGERWGPRELDLDLLLFGDEVIHEPALEVPHPEMIRRSFVLVPLLEIAPDSRLPAGDRLATFLEPDPAGVTRYAPPEALR